MTAHRIIIDTDPGVDDAIAIMLALASDRLKVEALVTVAGNVTVEQTARNACMILELAQRTDIPVHAGCARPIGHTRVSASHVHGVTGMDGPDLPAPTMPVQPRHGVDYLIDAIRDAPRHSLHLVMLGPMTNLAMALIKAPDIAARLRGVVAMGGARCEGGNITPSAEFNFYADPEAADIVLRSGIALTLLPLDVTHQCLTTPARLARLRALPGRCASAAVAMLEASGRFDLNKYGWAGAPLHDPCTIAWLLQPDLFAGRQVNVSISLHDPLTRGMSVVDWWDTTDRPANALFMHDANADGFYDLLTRHLARLP
ncbi:nucleoside hydrolase [Novacetimonas pomaceti]|uniref:Nucleoside hydrolase n=1 Tax=Novacetimonas pomaceti TaxID=2021998 RepID=A0A318QEC1_9PROT|nr:nucleoside hydrolase [Novacetimonas pomaceti]PYD75692.1 nucleoside hydrolase [Novacetimonas pomaceti]